MRSISIMLIMLALQACSGSRPVHLGSMNSHLEPCPDRPNCVSSLAPKHEDHYIEPLEYKNLSMAKEQLISIINAAERTKVVVESEDYVYAEYTSKTMGFVDDVEFLADKPNNLFQVRSASRLGYRDFDVNRERIESIRKALNK